MTEPGFATGKDGRLRFGIPVCTSSSAELLLDEALDSGHGLDNELDRLLFSCTDDEVRGDAAGEKAEARTDAKDIAMFLERLRVLEYAVVRGNNNDRVLRKRSVI